MQFIKRTKRNNVCTLKISFNLNFFENFINSLNSPGKPKKTYPSFGTDFGHMISVTESLIIGNENIDQNVQLE